MPRGIPKTKTNGSKAGGGNGAGITKREAVRQALAALGSDAKPAKLQEFVKSHFGIDMTTNNISAYKTHLSKQAGKKAQAAPQEAAAGDNQDISKMEAVRRALIELGGDAKPLQLQDFVRKTFGIAMQPQHISSYKSAISREGGHKKKATRKRRKPAAAPEPAAARGGITVQDLKEVKALADRMGAKRVRELLDVFSD